VPVDGLGDVGGLVAYVVADVPDWDRILAGPCSCRDLPGSAVTISSRLQGRALGAPDAGRRGPTCSVPSRIGIGCESRRQAWQADAMRPPDPRRYRFGRFRIGANGTRRTADRPSPWDWPVPRRPPSRQSGTADAGTAQSFRAPMWSLASSGERAAIASQ
jgi:hypothetical protein